MRIATLLPAATEIVCALGMEDALVGVSHECDFPRTVIGKPVLTSTRLFERTKSGEIDRDVRGLLREALAIYDVDVEALEQAAPDVIVTQDLCDVCAVSFESVRTAARALTRPDVSIVNLHPMCLEDLWSDISRVGRALDREREARTVNRELQARVESVRRRSARLATRPSLLSIEWLDPVMIGGLWMPEMIDLAGGRALASRAGEHAPTLSREELEGLAPDVVLVKPCGFPLARTLSEADTLRTLFEGLEWPALREGRVWIADGSAYFNRSGPRLVDSLEILAAVIHPCEFAEHRHRYQDAFTLWSA